jgi:SnoaL-like domain
MNAIEVVQRYNKAWNGRDADAIVAIVAERGTSSNPLAGQGFTWEAIGNYAKAVWTAFPDMTLKVVPVSEIGAKSLTSGCCVAPQWTVNGRFRGDGSHHQRFGERRH